VAASDTRAEAGAKGGRGHKAVDNGNSLDEANIAEAFATHDLWWGLESSIDDLLAQCCGEPTVHALILINEKPRMRGAIEGTI
jgi:hypothetical protein